MVPSAQDSPKGSPRRPRSRQDSHGNRQVSRSIPLPSSHVARTHSELQLSDDTEAAEWRDLCMFYRVVRGIRERQITHGMPIYEERFDRNGNCHQRWTSRDIAELGVARGTRSEASVGKSPLQHGAKVCDVSSLPPSMPASIQNDSGWSITGFDDDPHERRQSALNEEGISDDAVFEMDF